MRKEKNKINWKEYFNSLLSPTDNASSRKFITLIISAHFIMASFVVLFFAFYVIIWAPRGKTDVDLLKTLQIVLQYDFYIMLSGLGFITASDLVRVIISKGFNPNPFNIQNTTTEGDINQEASAPIDKAETKAKLNYD